MKSSLIIILFCFIQYGCSGCSESGMRSKSRNQATRARSSRSGDKIHVKMELIGGVYQIPVEVNGIKMSFIFDTGASDISISTTEAMFLAKQGLLSGDDIKGSQMYMDANGNISEGTVINLKTVQIGDRLLKNIKANVVDNLNAPLLFGQSALQKFGKVSIDYNNNEIIFE